MYCWNSAHLYDCINYECPVFFFKCASTYCVPVHKMCNSVKDCPLGEDEDMCGTSTICPGMMRCSSICVPVGLIVLIYANIRPHKLN